MEMHRLEITKRNVSSDMVPDLNGDTTTLLMSTEPNLIEFDNTTTELFTNHENQTMIVSTSTSGDDGDLVHNVADTMGDLADIVKNKVN